MIITIGGSVASGKTTLAKKISEKFNIRHISAGIVMREMAEEKGMSLLEFSKYAEKHPEIDKKIDERQKELSKDGGCIVEGRLSAYFIDSGLKVWLTAPIEVRARRVMQRDNFKNINEAKDKIKQRESSEKKRYMNFYNIDLDDLKIYDLIINTEKWDVLGVTEIVSCAVNKIKNYQ